MHYIETGNNNILNQWQLATRVVNPSDEVVRKKLLFLSMANRSTVQTCIQWFSTDAGVLPQRMSPNIFILLTKRIKEFLKISNRRSCFSYKFMIIFVKISFILILYAAAVSKTYYSVDVRLSVWDENISMHYILMQINIIDQNDATDLLKNIKHNKGLY